MIHLYYGEGKGKTTAAMGLALRAMGHGKRVVVVQFLKSGTSGELAPLKLLGAVVFSGKAGTKFVSQMSDEERAETRRLNDENLREAIEIPCDMLVLDEACAACALGMVDEEMMREFVERVREKMRLFESGYYSSGMPEIIITGRDPAEWMREAADYITEMRAERHPYERGVRAREGIEF